MAVRTHKDLDVIEVMKVMKVMEVMQNNKLYGEDRENIKS